MSTPEEILDALDNKLDEVDELIMSLPLPESVKKNLCANVYNLWAEVEEEMDLYPTDFG